MYLTVVVNTVVLKVMVGKSLLGGASPTVDLVLIKLAATSTIAQLKSIQMELALISLMIVNSSLPQILLLNLLICGGWHGLYRKSIPEINRRSSSRILLRLDYRRLLPLLLLFHVKFTV